MTIVGATAAAPHLLPSAKSTVEGGGQASLYPTPKKFDPKDSFTNYSRLPFAVGTSREPICELATDTPDSSQALLLLLSTDTLVEECGAHWRRRPLKVDAFPQSTQRLY